MGQCPIRKSTEMPSLGPRSLLPPGLVPEAVEVTSDTITTRARRSGGAGSCPGCGVSSGVVHSLHRHRVLDLPDHGRAVQLHVRMRRLRWTEAGRPRKTFTEPLSQFITGGSGRRTARLDGLVGDLGRSLGGRPAAALAERLMLPVGVNTLHSARLEQCRRRRLGPLSGSRPRPAAGRLGRGTDGGWPKAERRLRGRSRGNPSLLAHGTHVRSGLAKAWAQLVIPASDVGTGETE